MSDQAPPQKSGLGPVILAIVMLAVGFALGHLASDLNWIKGAPKLPEAKQPADGSTPPSSRGRDERSPRHDAEHAAEDAAAEVEGAVDDAAEKAEDVVDDAKEKLDDATGG